MTDLVVKPTNNHLFLDTSSSHPYHYKERVPYITKRNILQKLYLLLAPNKEHKKVFSFVFLCSCYRIS